MQKIREIATKVRQEAVDYYEDETLESMCLCVSRTLVEELTKEGIKCELIQGKFYVDNPDDSKWDEDLRDSIKYFPLHYWVRLCGKHKGTIIDLTCSQFQDECEDEIEDIFIGKKSESGRHRSGRVWA